MSQSPPDGSDPDTASHPPDGQPGSGNSPASGGDDAAPRASDRVAPGAPPPGANQGKAEVRPDGAGADRGDRDDDAGQLPPGFGTGMVGARSPGSHFPAGLTSTAARADSRVPVAPGDAPRAGDGGPTAQGGGGTAFRGPGELGSAPSPMQTDTAAGAARTGPGDPPQSTYPVEPTPGDLHGVPADAVEPAPGTSQDSSIVRGIKTPLPPAETDPDSNR